MVFKMDINDVSFDEENIGQIILHIDEKFKTSIKISTIENGAAQIYFNRQQIKYILYALKKAVYLIENDNSSFKKDQLEVITNINGIDEKNGVGFILIKLFNREQIGICISLERGVDPVLWLNVNQGIKLINEMKKYIK
ncbi:hypothetical protein G8V03_10090 [Clostridium botulinum D/C]|uniref:hypothetical protein n=1 Tax=Clostridium botulinum TaxID=1491 RepID=UPI001E3DD53F|nr:hypothetical protein [Clostridium botulinum]MCD3351333.1 hypothetical protein [Clostridium botulinum D/C]MCD3360289.1 hypothetical protein [Clostridium botulinum D/C]MCD3363402.1 hypothetical protein [Clostridium botulinum D/C]MCD3366064.1 hypothetical protein [Clostridium botulinum D/C]